MPLLKNRDFLLIWTGQLISMLGNDFHFIALMWLVYKLTNSSFVMGAVLFVSYLPSILFAPLVGAYVDLWDRKRTMVFSDIARCSIVLLFPLLYYLGALSAVLVLCLSFFLAALGVVYETASGAFLPNVVGRDELVRANSLSQVSFQLTNIVGSAAAGVLISAVGTANIFFIDSGSYAASAALISLVSRSGKALTEESLFVTLPGSLGNGIQPRMAFSEVLTRVKEGFECILGCDVMLTLTIMMAIMNFALGPFNVLMPIFSDKILGRGSEGFGFLMSSFSLGMLVGAFSVGKLVRAVRRGVAICVGVLLTGLIFGAFSFSRDLTSAIISLSFCGFFFAFPKVVGVSVVQDVCRDVERGRVLSIQLMFSNLLFSASMFISGLLAERVSVPQLLFVSALIIVVNGAYGLLRKSMRRSDV